MAPSLPSEAIRKELSPGAPEQDFLHRQCLTRRQAAGSAISTTRRGRQSQALVVKESQGENREGGEIPPRAQRCEEDG